MLKNISVTLDVEDLRPSDNFEDRSKLMTEKVLDLFAEVEVRATIFVVGDVARRHPEVIKKAVQAGHEIGLHSHKHIPLQLLNPDDFERELNQAKQSLEDISGQPVNGYRAPTMSLTQKTRWAIPIMQKTGLPTLRACCPLRILFMGGMVYQSNHLNGWTQ